MKSQPYHTVRTSKIHGRGVFAKRPIRKGVKILEYTGPIISSERADEIGADDKDGHSHTMLFQIDKDRVINGNEGGDARYINHSCEPNCEAVQYGDKIFIESLRNIPQGEELVYDYHLQVEGKITDKVKKVYACFCGSPKCRGTQIAADILKKQAKRDTQKLKKKEDKEKQKELAKLKKTEEKALAKTKKELLKAAEKNKKAAEKADKKKKKEQAESVKAEKKKSKKGHHKKADKKKKKDQSSLMVDTPNSSPMLKKKKKKGKK